MSSAHSEPLVGIVDSGKSIAIGVDGIRLKLNGLNG